MNGRILKLVTAAVEYPVSLLDMKEHLRVVHDDEDAAISAYIEAATSVVSEQIGAPLVSEVWDEGMGEAEPETILSKRFAQSLITVKYYDIDNVLQIADLSDYAVYAPDGASVVVSNNWPRTTARPDAVTIQYAAGYGAAADIPQHLKQAIKLIVGEWYENREDATEQRLTTITNAAKSLIGLSKGGWYG